MNKNFKIIINIIMTIYIIFFSTTFIFGCKKKRVQIPPTPTPTHTTVPSMEKIVYTYNGNLYWINIDGSGKEILFPDNYSKWFPSVSPSGWYIVYWVQKNGYYNLFLGDLKTKKVVQLTFDEEKIEEDIQNFRISNVPAWSQDESFILYSRNKNIWKISKDGYNQEAITYTHNCISPSLSKDNNIVYVKIENNETYNLYMRNIDYQNEEKLTNYSNKKVSSPCFSNDGKKVIFALNYGENIDILLLNISNKTTEQLSYDGKSLSPRFSYNNNKIVYTNFIDDKYQPELWIMNIDKSEKAKITNDGGYSPCWLYRILTEPLPTSEISKQKEVKVAEPIILETPDVQEVIEQQLPTQIPQQIEEELAIKLIKQDNKLLFYPVIQFDSGLANIKPEFYNVLDNMLIILKKYESPVIINGHTDNQPIHTKKYPSNYELSVDRANQVKKYLIKNGIHASRIMIKGYSDTVPLLPNNSPENMYKNRRAEILIDIIKTEENKILNDLITPTIEKIETPTPEPTATPTPKPKNFIEKLFKKSRKKSTITSW